MENLIKSYRSVAIALSFLFESVSEFYSRIRDDYDVYQLLIFYVQFGVVLALGYSILLGEEVNEDNKLVWDLISYVQMLIALLVFVVLFHFTSKLAGYGERFVDLFKYTVVVAILGSVSIGTFGFVADFYLYADTEFWDTDAISATDNIEYDGELDATLQEDEGAVIITENLTFLFGLAITLFAGFTFYYSVFRSWKSVATMATYAALYAFVLFPAFNYLQSNFLCKRLDICNIGDEGIGQDRWEAEMQEFDACVLAGRDDCTLFGQ